MHQNEAFSQRIDKALLNDQARHNFRTTMSGLMQSRANQFPSDDELQAIRDQSQAIRGHSLTNLPELLVKLEQKLTENGIQVHWAEDGEMANEIIYNIMQDAKAKSMVKGKSMVSEETELNDYLIKRGIDVIESDLGEFILQLAHEPPSHIVAPAIHKSRIEVAELFKKHFPELEYTEDVDKMTLMARQILRNKFADADVGLSGVNFAVAETGTLCLVENEGNGRLSTTAPDIHIAITGIEKVVEKLSDVPPLLSILTRSATGQPVTTYFNMISHPRQSGEKDGPRTVHLVLLDNRRSRIRMDEELLATLRCIRCGACMNHCPVYVQVGGHAYGTVYPGPIGTVLEPQRIGLDKIGALTSACSMCGACAEVCPVKIPLPKLINRLRAESVNDARSNAQIQGKGSMRKNTEGSIWKIWKSIYSSPTLYRMFTWTATRFRFITPPGMSAWTHYRTAPKPAAKSLSELARQEGFDHE